MSLVKRARSVVVKCHRKNEWTLVLPFLYSTVQKPQCENCRNSLSLTIFSVKFRENDAFTYYYLDYIYFHFASCCDLQPSTNFISFFGIYLPLSMQLYFVASVGLKPMMAWTKVCAVFTKSLQVREIP